MRTVSLVYFVLCEPFSFVLYMRTLPASARVPSGKIPQRFGALARSASGVRTCTFVLVKLVKQRVGISG